MAHPHEAVIRGFYDAFSSGNTDAMSGALAPDVVWHEGGRNQLSGYHEGVDAVMGNFARLADVVGESLRIEEVHDVLANDEHVVSLHVIAAERHGKPYRIKEVIVWHVADGVVTEVWPFAEDQQAADELIG